MIRTWMLIALAFTTAAAHAEKIWSLAPRPGAIASDAQARTDTITSGGCTVTVTPAALGALLTFTCPETAWRVYVRNTDKGLQIRRAELRRTPAGNFMRVIYEANIAEIFVPYHDGDWMHRLSDNQFCSAALCIQEMTSADLTGMPGELITMQGDAKPTAAVEIRDRGVAWMCKSATKSFSRRGQDMVVWGTWDTGNYDYIIEYTFRDDGQISFRLGASGFDNPGLVGMAHMHDILWRVDVDLNGDLNDSAVLESHQESGLAGIDSEVAFNNDVEGAARLDPYQFAALVVEDAAVNQRGRHLAYELQPFRRGVAEHAEAWCHDDVWVTRFKSAEPAVPAAWTPPDAYLLGTAAKPWGIYDQEPIASRDVVIWHSSPIHHEPHDEDQSPLDTGSTYAGMTLMHWTGFDLVPQNIFDYNPLGGPDKTLCD